MRCFPSFQNFFLQENAPFSVSNALIFAHLLRFQCDLMRECNLVFIHWCFRSKFNIRCCSFVFPGTRHRCFKRQINTSILSVPDIPQWKQVMKSSQCTSELFYYQQLNSSSAIQNASNWLWTLHSKLKLPFIKMHSIIDRIFTKFYAIK